MFVISPKCANVILGAVSPKSKTLFDLFVQTLETFIPSENVCQHVLLPYLFALHPVTMEFDFSLATAVPMHWHTPVINNVRSTHALRRCFEITNRSCCVVQHLSEVKLFRTDGKKLGLKTHTDGKEEEESGLMSNSRLRGAEHIHDVRFFDHHCSELLVTCNYGVQAVRYSNSKMFQSGTFWIVNCAVAFSACAAMSGETFLFFVNAFKTTGRIDIILFACDLKQKQVVSEQLLASVKQFTAPLMTISNQFVYILTTPNLLHIVPINPFDLRTRPVKLCFPDNNKPTEMSWHQGQLFFKIERMLWSMDAP